MDDLFGSDNTPATNDNDTPKMSRIIWKELRFFTGITAANRHARDVFMQWFMDNVRGNDNFRYISMEGLSIEE